MPERARDLIPLMPGERPRVLVVDDEPRLRQVLARLMTRDGFECLEAGDGAEALALVEHDAVPLVLSDLRMPHVDGIALLREMRVRHPDTAVLILSATAEVDVAVSCLGMGAMDYLTKPFQLDEVRARVHQALEKRRLVLENRKYRLHLEELVAEQQRRLETLFLASMQSLADALEVKDPYTRGHSVRVSRYAAATARVFGLGDDVIREVDLGGHLHDLGKIGVREEVLNKPARLSAEEYAHIMTHPVIGWRLLGPLLEDRPLALAVVRSHHERWDGQGVPDGLAGTAIPLVARVAAVADGFDAMTSHRPYRRGRTLEDAVAEIVRCAGAQYDPDVVAAFAGAVADGTITLLA